MLVLSDHSEITTKTRPPSCDVPILRTGLETDDVIAAALS